MTNTLKRHFLESIQDKKVKFPDLSDKIFIVKDVSFASMHNHQDDSEPLVVTAQFTCVTKDDPTPRLVLIPLDDHVEFID